MRALIAPVVMYFVGCSTPHGGKQLLGELRPVVEEPPVVLQGGAGEPPQLPAYRGGARSGGAHLLDEPQDRERDVAG